MRYICMFTADVGIYRLGRFSGGREGAAFPPSLGSLRDRLLGYTHVHTVLYLGGRIRSMDKINR